MRMVRNCDVLFFLFCSLLFGDIYAQGNLMIAPMRVELDENIRRRELSLVNTGKDTASFEISFVHYRMAEDGRLIKVSELDTVERSASKFLQVFPRLILLAPKEEQVICVVFRRTSQINSGEYRSRLYFRATNISASGLKDLGKVARSVDFQITPILGITIPVFVRVGELSGSVSISNIALHMPVDSISYLSFDLLREGEVSYYGIVEVDFISETGKIVSLGRIRGVAIYTDICKRVVKIALKPPSGFKFRSGQIRVKYLQENTSSSSVYAQGLIDVVLL